MLKKTFLTFIVFNSFAFLQSAYAICASKIIFVQDDSQSVQYRIHEANRIRDALDGAVGAGNYIHIPISRAHTLGEQAVGETPPSDGSTGWGYTLPNLALASAVKRCDQNCTNADALGRNYKCAILYWSDNIITHKNPNLAIHDYNAFKKTMDDTNGTAINSSHRFLVNLSFVSNDGSIDAELRAMSQELYDIAQAASYRGVEFRTTPTTELTQDQINSIIAAILDRFGHAE